MSVLLRMAYAGYLAGTTVELPFSVEAALIAQGLATAAASANITPGPVTANVQQGVVAVAAGQSSLVVTNNQITPNSTVMAVVSQAAADGTFLRVERIVCGAGFFTIYGTAAATATTFVDWAIVNSPGLSTSS
jgi:hypothetical protein